jgi:hypothetical protein
MGDYILSFRRDGTTWTCVAPVTIDHPRGRIQVAPGSSFSKGTNFMGVDLAAWLDHQMVKAWKKPRERPQGE